MSRYVRDVVLNKPVDFVQFIMNDFLGKNQYQLIDQKGESVYRAGDAMVEGYKYFKWGYMNGVFHVEAWLQGITGAEMDLDGFVGTLNKKPYKDNIEQLIAALSQPLPNQPVQGGQGMPPYQQPIPVHMVDNTDAASKAKLFGILSIVLCWIPIAGIIFATLAFSRARMGMASSSAQQAKTGKTCATIGLVLSIALWVINIMVILM